MFVHSKKIKRGGQMGDKEKHLLYLLGFQVFNTF